MLSQRQKQSLDGFYQNGRFMILYRMKLCLKDSILANYTITEWSIGVTYSIRDNYWYMDALLQNTIAL